MQGLCFFGYGKDLFKVNGTQAYFWQKTAMSWGFGAMFGSQWLFSVLRSQKNARWEEIFVAELRPILKHSTKRTTKMMSKSWRVVINNGSLLMGNKKKEEFCHKKCVLPWSAEDFSIDLLYEIWWRKIEEYALCFYTSTTIGNTPNNTHVCAYISL